MNEMPMYVENCEEESRKLLEEAYKAVQENTEMQEAVMEDSEESIEHEIQSASVVLDDVVFGEKTLSMREASRQIQRSNQKAVRLSIKRELAKNGDLELLSRSVPAKVKKLMIPEATKKVKESIASLKVRIDKKVTALMEPLIPLKIRLARALCGDMPFKQHPGFMWISSKENGSGRLWVTPNIPCYFEQFTEMDVIQRYCPAKRIRVVERLIGLYLSNIASLSQKEAKLAIKLQKIDTYEELLRFNVSFFRIAYDEYKASKAEEAKALREEGQDDLADRIENVLINIEGIEEDAKEDYLKKYSEKIKFQ